MTDQPIPLAANFEALTIDDWRALAEAALKGADFDKALVSQTYDGIAINPVYPRAENAQNITHREADAWTIVQRVDQPAIGAASKQALIDLENGASGLAIVFAGAPTAYGYGTGIATVDDLDQTLTGVYPDIIRLRLEAGPAGVGAAALLAALCEKRSIDIANLDVSLGCDPFGAALLSGSHPDRGEIIPQFMDMAQALEKRGFKGQIAMADGRIWHAGGASEAQELAGILASAIAYLCALEKTGIALETVAGRIGFAVAADADQFMSIAKIRALNMLWRQICAQCGVENAPVHIHAETAWRMMSKRDVYVNMLRATMATFSAGISGVDSITVLPFTTALGLPDEFARRIARNTQLVLAEESNLARVGDPVTGSGFAEAMTNELAEKAWEIFQRIESTGGLAAALKDGWVQNEVADTRKKRGANIARRKDPLTGVSEFPDLGEGKVEVLGGDPPCPPTCGDPLDLPEPGTGAWFDALVAAAANGASLGQLAARKMDGFAIQPLIPVLQSAAFETLRDASDARTEENGDRPRVFLANLGTLASFSARASWARNMFGAGGIEAPAKNGFTDPDAAAAAFRESGARLACICATDSVYADQGAATAKALKAAGARHVFLAGRPGENRKSLEDAGIDTFVHAGCDIVEILETAFAALGLDVKGDEE